MAWIFNDILQQLRLQNMALTQIQELLRTQNSLLAALNDNVKELVAALQPQLNSAEIVFGNPQHK